jgi:DNA-binding beta-propeller fold protein YncE
MVSYRKYITLFLGSIVIMLIIFPSTLAQDEDTEMVQTPTYTLIEDWRLGGDGDSQFMGPNAIVIDSEDNIYITEFMGNRVQKFNSDGELIIAWGSEGSDDGQFRNPTGIAIDSENNIYVSESGNSRVQKFTSDGDWLATWGGRGSNDGQFLSAMVIIIDSEERVYVSDWGNSRIQVFDTDGEFLMTWGEQGSASGQLLNPTGVTIDSDGNVWVVDRGNHRVQSFTPDGDHLSTWGSQGSEDGQFMAPTSIAIDTDGLIYVSEADGTRVQILTPEGEFLVTTLSILNSPHGMDFDSDEALYITDTFNGIIRKMERKMSNANSATDTSLAPLPQRLGQRPSTTGNVPHQQIGIEPVRELNDTLFRWVASLPNIELQPSISSLPGATGIWITQGTVIAQPQVILNGREFTHIHPDGSLHAPLPPARAIEAVETGWAERHPWADQRVGWEGLVMLYTPQSETDLEIVFQLIVESYNFVTGKAEVSADYFSS